MRHGAEMHVPSDAALSYYADGPELASLVLDALRERRREVQRQERRLLHLDLHPYNVLVDDDGEPTGVIDWTNAAGGDPQLDAARTWSILVLDPAAIRLRANPGWRVLTENWLQAERLREIPAAARAWACSFMLEDLAQRHAPAALAHVRDALRQAEAEAGEVRRDAARRRSVR